jgi:phosphoribosylamine---glycine ligase
MNVLILGSGGREHALAWKIAQSPLLTKLFIAPGNAGTLQHGVNAKIAPDDFDAVATFALENQIGLVVVGPEAPLVNGIYDHLSQNPDLKHISIIGPSKAGALLEGSKDFAKAFMQRHSIPTAAYKTFTAESLDEGLEFLKKMNPPYVLKADGLAAGKGVIIVDELAEAQKLLADMLKNLTFGEASRKVVVEEFLDGIELSVFVLTDGKDYLLLPEAKDYKRIGEGDTGLNTGGMGSVSPVPFADKALMEKIKSLIIKPTIEGLSKEEIDYKGFIFFGLINSDGLPKVIEYNCRMGDPEAEVVIPRIQSDLLPLFASLKNQHLASQHILIDPRAAATVFLVSGGYPGDYEKGKKITGLEAVSGSAVFHAGTRADDPDIVTSGGRVLAVTTIAKDIPKALALSYENAARIHFDGKYFRSDLGRDLLD